MRGSGVNGDENEDKHDDEDENTDLMEWQAESSGARAQHGLRYAASQRAGLAQRFCAGGIYSFGCIP
jgi:hypothetical protein